jgi:hypothetical protein
VYGVSVSGFIYGIIRDTPWVGAANPKTQLPMVISPSSEQFALEGIIVAVLNGLIALGLLAAAYSTKLGLGEPASVAVALLGVGVSFGCYLRILGLYGEKTRWYKVSALIPDYVQKWANKYSAKAFSVAEQWVGKEAVKLWSKY